MIRFAIETEEDFGHYILVAKVWPHGHCTGCSEDEPEDEGEGATHQMGTAEHPVTVEIQRGDLEPLRDFVGAIAMINHKTLFAAMKKAGYK